MRDDVAIDIVLFRVIGAAMPPCLASRPGGPASPCSPRSPAMPMPGSPCRSRSPAGPGMRAIACKARNLGKQTLSNVEAYADGIGQRLRLIGHRLMS